VAMRRGSMLFVALLALALFGRVACDDEDGGDDYAGGGGDDYPGDGDDEYDGMGDMGGGEAPPPEAGPVQELSSVEDFEAFIDNNDASVIGAFTAKEVVDPTAEVPEGWDEEEDGVWQAPQIENPSLTAFNTITSAVYGYRFAYSTAPEVLAKLKSKAGGVYLYRSPKFVSKDHGDRPRERFPSEKLSESAVSNWLAAKAQPLVGEYDSTTSSRYTTPVLVIFMNLDFEQNAKAVTYVLKRARKVAASLKGQKLAVAVASSSKMSYQLADFGLTATKPNTDTLMGIHADGRYYHAADGVALSGTTLAEFARAFLAGELTAYEKPEEPPAPEGGMEDDAGAEGYGDEEEGAGDDTE